MKHIKTFELFVNESQLNDTIINNTKLYFYGMSHSNSSNSFSPYGIKLFKSMDENNLLYTIWRFGEETQKVTSKDFSFSVSAYKSEGKTIQDAYKNLSNVIKYIENEIEECEKYIIYLDTRSTKSKTEKKSLTISKKKQIKFYNEIIKDIKTIKLT